MDSKKKGKVIEQYDNIKIIRLEDSNVPIYEVEEYKFTESERKLLNNHSKIFTEIELDTVRKEPDISLRRQVIHAYLKMKIPETKNKEALISAIINQVIGYGPLSHFINDKNLEEIMVNGVNTPVFVFHRRYGMCKTRLKFHEKDEILKIINRLCWIHNKPIKPIIDLSTIDGSRANITMDPLTIRGPTLTIRKQKRHFFTITELIDLGTLSMDLAALLWFAADGMRLLPANIIICGSIGAGKTSLLNALAMLTPPEERIITIEETPELRLEGKDNWIPLTSSDDYSMADLVKDSLRMRPNRIIVGEIRGAEAMSLFNSMNVGHKGMGTMHSSSAREAIYRLQGEPMNVPLREVSNLDLIVVQNIFNIGGIPQRRITEVATIGGHEGETILLGNVYEWDPENDKSTQSALSSSTFLDKFAEKAHIKKKKVVDELNRRRVVLRTLLDNDIFSHDDLSKAISTFYREEGNLDAVVGEVGKKS